MEPLVNGGFNYENPKVEYRCLTRILWILFVYHYMLKYPRETTVGYRIINNGEFIGTISRENLIVGFNLRDYT
jgi:hypothetical protein